MDITSSVTSSTALTLVEACEDQLIYTCQVGDAEQCDDFYDGTG